jgi:ribonuclease HI
MLIIRRPKRRRFRHKARHKSRNVPPCKHWHDEAAQLYHEQLVKDQQLKAGVVPKESSCRIPTVSQPTEPLPPNHENVLADPAQVKGGYVAWFDGACEPFNPGGTASFGAIIKDEAGTILLKEHGLVGRGEAMSNNVAEYAGVLHILKYLAPRRPGRVTTHGDANLVINQLNGKWRIKKGLYLSIAIETRQLLAHLREHGWQINLRWIPRDQNEERDALSRSDPRVMLKTTSRQLEDGTAGGGESGVPPG